MVNQKICVNELFRIQVNEYGNSILINQEIYATRPPNMEHYQVVDCVKYTKYCSKNIYNIYKNNNSNTAVTTMQW